MIDLLDFNLFVSMTDYNKVQTLINEKIKKDKESGNK